MLCFPNKFLWRPLPVMRALAETLALFYKRLLRSPGGKVASRKRAPLPWGRNESFMQGLNRHLG
jgi:hypothetical protein